MGALLDAYEAAKLKKAQIPEVAALPETYAPAYYSAMGKPYEAPKTAHAGDIYTSVRDAYKSTGGGLKGGLKAVLAGLGKTAEYMSTKEGQQILSGLTADPYLAAGYLNNAAQAGSEERAGVSSAASANMERMKQMGEDVREASKSAAAARQAESNIILQNSLNEPQLNLAQKNFDLSTKREAREADESAAELARKPVAEQRDAVIKAAQEAFKKGSITAEALAEISANPDSKQIVNRGLWSHIVPFVKTATVVDKPPTLEVGTTRKGYTYLGGDPGSPASWRKI